MIQVNVLDNMSNVKKTSETYLVCFRAKMFGKNSKNVNIPYL